MQDQSGELGTGPNVANLNVEVQDLESFRSFVCDGPLRALISEVLETHERFKEVSRQSYVHVNEFDKYVLWTADNGARLVWHQWHYTNSHYNIEYHNHRWNFLSHVVSGSLTEECMKLAPDENDGISVDHHIYNHHRGRDTYSLTRLARSALALDSSQTIDKGTTYFKSYKDVHRSWAREAHTNTIILQGPVVSAATDVYLPDGKQSQGDRLVERISDHRLRAALLELNALLCQPNQLP